MRYVLAILFPPIAVFLCRRPFQGFVNLILTLCFWVPGMIHALLVVFDRREEERAKQVMESIRQWQRRVAV